MAITVGTMIDLVDELEPNQYDSELKMAWLSELDAQIYIEVVAELTDPIREAATEYDSEDAELLIQFPYGRDIYSYYLQAKIAAENAEMSRYNALSILYEGAFERWERSYIRHRSPIPKRSTSRFWF